ncbi:glycosyltransferase [Tamlana crocina]|uniref:Glycosyltransferase family 4 protein n=1 Tax=Tamlana crocina TaxID=393006 RepID=A0ABX1DFF5_9FLAO|nr:glycosyltransferase [Tamlana crocina]NJX15031.1 glycosyltransferase family 4 protein [Tamlana crocina]
MSKILFITTNDHVSWGGSEELWSKTALTLINSYEVGVVKAKWTEEHDIVKSILVSGGSVYYKLKTNRKSIIEKVINAVKLKLGIKRPRSNDLEIVEDLCSYNLAVVSVGDHVDQKIVSYTSYLRKLGLPYVILVQLATNLRHLSDNQVFNIKTAYDASRGIGYLSKENYNVLKMQLGLTLNNAFKINNPFEFNQVYLPIVTNSYYQFACVASFCTFHKGQDMLLNVLSQDKWKQRNWILNLYGSGDNEKQLMDLVDFYKLNEKVVFKGYVENKEDIWRLNHILVMPSRMEGQSLAMLEAMSYGRMVISTNVGAAQELIDDGITGFLAKAPTVEFIDEALESAWQVRDKWLEMGKLSRKKLYEVIPHDPVLSFSNKLKELIR